MNSPEGLETIEEITAAVEKLETRAKLRKQQELKVQSSTDDKRLREIKIALERLKSKTKLKKQRKLEVPSGNHDQRQFFKF